MQIPSRPGAVVWTIVSSKVKVPRAKLKPGRNEMDNPVMMDVSADEAARLEAAIDECIAAMKVANAKMASDQLDIEQLRAETRSMLAQL